MTHTPGKWSAQFKQEDVIYGVPICAKGRSPRRHVPVANVPVDYTDRKEREANARLIAAAPELLEALKMALEALTEDSNAQVRLETAGWVEAAIAKAEGRS